MRTLERKYDARITAVYQHGASGADGQTGPEDSFTYDAQAVDTGDVVSVSNESPFRRWLFADGSDTPMIVAASVGDDCEIAVCGGESRLVDVPEQYIVGDCDTGG